MAYITHEGMNMITEFGEHSIGKDRQVGYNDKKVNAEIGKTFKRNVTADAQIDIALEKLDEKSVARSRASVSQIEINNSVSVLNGQIDRLAKDQTMTHGAKLVEKVKIAQKAFTSIDKSLALASTESMNEMASVQKKLFSNDLNLDPAQASMIPTLATQLKTEGDIGVLISNSASEVEVKALLVLSRDFPSLAKSDVGFDELSTQANYRFSKTAQDNMDALITLNKQLLKTGRDLGTESSEFIDQSMVESFTANRYES